MNRADPPRLRDEPMSRVAADLRLVAWRDLADFDVGAGRARLQAALASSAGIGPALAKWTLLVLGGLVAGGLLSASTPGAARPVRLHATHIASLAVGPALHAEPLPPVEPALARPAPAFVDAEERKPVATHAAGRRHGRSAAAQTRRARDREMPDEIEATAAMRRACRRSPDACLQHYESAHRRFGSGVLGVERLAYYILALYAVGDEARASRLARRYVLEHPAGPKAEKIRTRLSASGDEAGP